MRTTNRYLDFLCGTALQCYVEDGIRDPSIVEIACKGFNHELPDNPLVWPDVLGGEIFQGVSKRLAEMRNLLDQRGHACSPVGYQYYAMKMRGRIPAEHQVPMCLPNGGPRREYNGVPIDNRPYGLRFVLDGEDDPIYALHTGGKGIAFTNGLLRVEQQIIKAHAIGAISKPAAMDLADQLGGRLKITPAEMKNRIGNGHDPEEEPTPV